jgi:enoyl-CoA hydratase/carnithine racemase
MIVSSTAQFVELAWSGKSAAVTLARPDRLNAVSPQLVSELRGVLESAVSAGARVLTIKEPPLESNSKEFGEHLENLQAITRILRNSGIVTIASVHGYALGAGLEIALSCDFVIVSKDASLGFPEVSVGLSVTGGVSWLLPRTVGMAAAKRLLLLSGRFSADEALQMGLITYAVEHENLDQKTSEIVERVLAQPERSLALAKQYLQDASNSNLDEAMDAEVRVAFETAINMESEEARARFSGRGKN